MIHQNIKHNFSLKPYNTFGIDVSAKYFTSVSHINDLKTILELKLSDHILVIGGGSNLLFTKDFNGLVIHINIKGIEIVRESNNTVIVGVNAGENWHDFVLWAIKHDFGGIENLSLIPGNVGTAPVQNIGAYGMELKDVFESCEGINIKTGNTICFNNADCNFGYRDSIFKKELKNQFIITRVYFKLSKKPHHIHMAYGAISTELEHMGIEAPTIADVSNAVINIRRKKLPDPKHIGNSGSFFKNPIVSKSHFDHLKLVLKHDIPHYVISEDSVKIPAGWLIEHTGFKGKRFNNYGVHEKQALVLVNHGNAKGSDILNLSKLIQKTVKRLFDITLETEVNIL